MKKLVRTFRSEDNDLSQPPDLLFSGKVRIFKNYNDDSP
jgi:hypothetical protein